MYYMFQYKEHQLIKKLSKYNCDKLILSTKEYKQLLSYYFDSVDDLNAAKYTLFHDDVENRLFRNHLIIEINNMRYYYIFNNKKSQLQICKLIDNELHLNGIFNFKINRFEIDLTNVTGISKFREVTNKIADELRSVPYFNLNTKFSENLMIQKINEEFYKLAQESIDLLIGVAHYVLTNKEIRVVKNEFKNQIKTTKDTENKRNQAQKNRHRVIKLSKIIYERDQKNNDITQRKTREYKATEWEVRGHWREYKNGKCVWIKPYIKGKIKKIQVSLLLTIKFTN